MRNTLDAAKSFAFIEICISSQYIKNFHTEDDPFTTASTYEQYKSKYQEIINSKKTLEDLLSIFTDAGKTKIEHALFVVGL